MGSADHYRSDLFVLNRRSFQDFTDCYLDPIGNVWGSGRLKTRDDTPVGSVLPRDIEYDGVSVRSCSHMY